MVVAGLALLAALLLVGAVLSADAVDSLGLQALSVVFACLAVVAIMGVVVALSWRRIMSSLTRHLTGLAGPALIRSMPPRDVLGALLPWVYGDRVDHGEVLTGILGGPGREIQARDTAVSKGTSVHFKLAALNDEMLQTDQTFTHEFSGVRDNYMLVLFGTLSLEILRLVVTEREYPLFELWRVHDEDQLDEFVPNIRNSLQLGITYRDSMGEVHNVPPGPCSGEEAALRHFDRFVRLPDRIDRKDLRIVSVDLHDLADPDHIVAAVEGLSMTVSSKGRLDLGYSMWSPPHPCFLKRVTFDIAELATPGKRYRYLVLTSLLQQGGIPQRAEWVDVHDKIEVDVDSWMLPGHSVTLLWRLDDDTA
jgi:hypothetical protein